MCTLPAAIIGAAVLGAGASAYSASKASKAQSKANATNERIAAQQAQQAEEQFNKQNQKQPDIAAMMKNNMNSMRQGIGATFLTGPSGAPVNTGLLGGNSLLGGA